MGTDSSEEQKKLSSFLMLAEQADQSGNHQEAFNFYTKALEIDPLNPDAWFGKGKAAGWSSTVLNVRLLEMVQGISNAVKFAPDERKADLSVQGAAEMNSTANAIFSAAFKLYQENVDSRKLCWAAIEQCLRALDTAHDLNPKSIKLMESIIIFAGNSKSIPFSATAAQKELASQLKAKYEARIKVLDPNHTIPTSGCFVVTATLGDEKNIFVKDFRFLRDSVMVQYRLGQSFANWYLTLRSRSPQELQFGVCGL